MSKVINVYNVGDDTHYQFKQLDYSSNSDLDEKELAELTELLGEMNELNGITKSLNGLVVEQKEDLVIAQTNIETTDVHVEKAVEELTKAETYKKNGYIKKVALTSVVLLTTIPVGIIVSAKVALIVGAVGLVGGGAALLKK